MSSTWEIEGFLESTDTGLKIDGVSAVELAREHGTPLFVFSERRIAHNIDRLRRTADAIDRPIKICYAAKAMSTMGILKAVKDAGSDIEVNSGGELWKALEVGFDPQQIIFNGTSKEIWELEMAVSSGIFAIQVDSVFELALIEETARRLGKTATVSLRLVPEIESATHSGLRTALLTSKFGMMPAEALEAFRRFNGTEHLSLAGIHLHIGSQNPDAAGYAEALEVLFHNLLEIFNETGVRLTHLNLGGGFPVNYLRDDSQKDEFGREQREMFEADFEPADAVANAWNVVRRSAAASKAEHLLEGLTLLLEPGRSVIADAGICLTSVRNIKERPIAGESDASLSDKWLLTDAGFNILLSMETYKWYYHLLSAERSGKPHSVPYKVAGPLCDGGDVYFDHEGLGRLPDHRLLPAEVRPGEVLALLNCGAYSLSQASQYNARFLPAVVLIAREGTPKLIRRRDTFRDLASNDVY